MGKFIETKIDRFDGGISNDPRDSAENIARVVTNFDILTNPRKMTPYRDSESGDANASTSQKQNFVVALWGPTSTYRLFGLGVQSAQPTRAEIQMKALTTGASNDLDDSAWADPANNTASQNNTSFNLFVYYAKTGKIYGAHTGTHIWAFTPDGATAFANTHQALTYTNIAQGLVHSKDDILYVPYDNKIAKNDNGSWTVAALTLPTHYFITSICEYGNYLAILAVPLSGVGNSRVYLWDRDSSLVTISESVDWGPGTGMILEEVDGVLVGISQEGGAGSTFSGVPNGVSSFRDRVVFRFYAGGGRAEKFKELIGSANGTLLPIAKQKINNRLYFMMSVSLNGVVREGVWSVGRSLYNQAFTVIHERTPNNDTALTSGQLKGFFAIGDYLFQSYVSSSTYGLSKTNDTASYTHTSIYETKTFDAGDPSLKKDLVGVTVMTEYLPTAGQVVLKYAIDNETSYTTIFTEATDNSISHSAVNIESSGAFLPRDYKEIRFRIESTGGAEITGFSFKEEITDKRLY